MDLGCGGGFRNTARYHVSGLTIHINRLIGQEDKGLRVASAGLDNVELSTKRAEELDVKVDYIIAGRCRSQKPFLGWCWDTEVKGRRAWRAMS